MKFYCRKSVFVYLVQTEQMSIPNTNEGCHAPDHMVIGSTTTYAIQCPSSLQL